MKYVYEIVEVTAPLFSILRLYYVSRKSTSSNVVLYIQINPELNIFFFYDMEQDLILSSCTSKTKYCTETEGNAF